MEELRSLDWSSDHCCSMKTKLSGLKVPSGEPRGSIIIPTPLEAGGSQSSELAEVQISGQIAVN